MSTDSAAPESKLPTEYKGSRALSVYDRVTNPIEAVERVGLWIHKSGMYGASKDQGNILALHCFAQREDPLNILKTQHLVGGKLQMKADAMLAEFHAIGGKHKILKRTPEGSSVQLRYDGESYTFDLMWDDVQEEPFIKDKNGKVQPNYATPLKRKQMLWARLISDSIRCVAPEVNAGRYTPEEITGEWSDEYDGDVIDAEFTASNDAPPSEAKPAAAEPAPEEPPFDTSQQTQQPVSGSEEPTAAAESSPPPQEPTIDVNPQQTLTQRNRDELLKLLATAKKQLEEADVLDAEKWKATLAKRNVTTARDLTDEQIQGLLWRLWDGIEKRKLAADLDVWINTALHPAKN